MRLDRRVLDFEDGGDHFVWLGLIPYYCALDLITIDKSTITFGCRKARPRQIRAQIPTSHFRKSKSRPTSRLSPARLHFSVSAQKEPFRLKSQRNCEEETIFE